MVLLTAVVVLLLLLLVLLAVPLCISYRLSWPQPTQREVTLEWAFGLLRIELPQSPPAVARQRPFRSRRAKRKRPAAPSRHPVNLLSLLRQAPFRRRLFKYFRDCWAALDKQALQLRLRIGLDDPADTGQLWAIMGPLSGLLANSREVALTLQPEFERETFELESSGRIAFSPLQLLTLTAALLLSPTVWRGVWQQGRTA